MTQQYKVGLHNVGSYQVSGKPFATGSIDCRTGVTGVGQIDFPQVTSWVMISNHDSGNRNVRVGFSSKGVLGSNTEQGNRFIEVPSTSGSGPVRLDLKLTQLFVSGSDNVSVVAGLTFISTGSINNIAISPAADEGSHVGKNWSGSTGI